MSIGNDLNGVFYYYIQEYSIFILHPNDFRSAPRRGRDIFIYFNNDYQERSVTDYTPEQNTVHTNIDRVHGRRSVALFYAMSGRFGRILFAVG